MKMHEEICFTTQRLAFPEPPNNIMKFKNYKHKLQNKIVVYCDSESILEQCDGDGVKNSIQSHKLYYIGIYVCNKYNPRASYYKQCYGKDVLTQFFQEMKKITDDAFAVSRKSPYVVRLFF